MKTYLVGGAVRDRLLNLPIKDQDWVVVGTTPSAMLDAGYKQVGADFPVFLHPDSQEEYALARTERKSGKGYKGFDVAFGEDVTLEEDLQRRDLTINAMAQSASGEIIDPYNGQQDLEDRLLRHVSDAFQEDPLRVLRVARFAARFHHLGFRVAEETMHLMGEMVRTNELTHLTAERVWQETERALSERSPWIFFEVLKECGCLAVCFPEIDALFGVPQPKEHHPEIDVGIHTMMCLQQATLLSEDTQVRFATLVHDLGKATTPIDVLPRHIGHEKRGLSEIKTLCKRLRIPNDFRDLGLKVCEFHTHIHRALSLKPSTIWKVFKATDALRKPKRFEQLLVSCVADSRGRTGFENVDYPQQTYMQAMLNAAKNVDIQSLVNQGLTGAALGQAIEEARITAIQSALPNE